MEQQLAVEEDQTPLGSITIVGELETNNMDAFAIMTSDNDCVLFVYIVPSSTIVIPRYKEVGRTAKEISYKRYFDTSDRSRKAKAVEL